MRKDGKPPEGTRARKASTYDGHRKMIVSAARRRCVKSGVLFELDYRDINIPEYCPVLGIPLFPSFGKRGPQDNSPTLDRIVCSKGYVPGNVEVISWKANRLKSDATPHDLRLVADYYGKKDREQTAATNKEKARSRSRRKVV